jgi:hypothetical protein
MAFTYCMHSHRHQPVHVFRPDHSQHKDCRVCMGYISGQWLQYVHPTPNTAATSMTKFCQNPFSSFQDESRGPPDYIPSLPARWAKSIQMQGQRMDRDTTVKSPASTAAKGRSSADNCKQWINPNNLEILYPLPTLCIQP